MEKKLEKLMAEVRAGFREGSVVSTYTAHTVEQIDEDELWLRLRRELEDVGISPQLLSEKKDFIVSWIKKVIAEGTLEEVSNNDDDLQLPEPTLSPQQNNALGRASSSGAVSPGLSPKAPKRRSSSRLLSARWFLNKILQDEKKFLAAAETGNIAIITEQLKYGTDKEAKNEYGLTALYIAASNGHEKVVKVLLDGGVEKEAKTEIGFTALHIAASNGHEKVVKVLLDGGVEKEAKNEYGSTALHIAALNGHEKVVKVLLDGGVEKEAKNKRGLTALHLAAFNGHEKVVKVLLDGGVEKEAKAEDGSTALHIAAFNGHEKVVKVLLDGGAEKAAMDNRGWTALRCALEGDKAESVKLLE
jgi:ankyrin repeat protein